MISNPHNLQIDAQNNVYVADRGNRRIQVFDTDGNFKRFIFQNAPYDKNRHPVLGNKPTTSPDESAPWALCITKGSPQYLFSVDSEPGRLYKMTLDGKIVGMLGLSGHEMGQFNWPHGLACPDENTVIVADMNNWRVQKITLKGAARSTATASR
jgi:DNA-binding beta-propeller fold protein YncE